MPGFRSVRLRLTLWYVLLLAAILAAFSGGIYLALRQQLYVSLDTSLRSRATTVLEVIEYENGRPTLSGTISAFDPNVGEHFVRLFDTTGAVTFDDSTAMGDIPIDPRAVQAALAGRPTTRSVSAGGETLRTRTVPIQRNSRVFGVLEVGLRDEVPGTLRSLLVIFAVAGPVTLLLASLGGIFLAERALAPIDKVTRVARRISAEDLSQRLDLRLPDDEVGRLARTFDEMIARLDDAFRRQRQFTADASHELRTPLTAIKGQVEVALARPRRLDAYREVLRNVNEEVDRLIRLVGSLLTLARADAGQIPIASEPVNLAGLVAAGVEQVRPAGEGRRVELIVAPGPPVTLRADEDLLLHLLLNLLDNALKHTEAGGRVVAGWGLDDGCAELWVRDTGAGIAAEHLGRIFDRFYRADKARSRAEGGAGLGLSICRWIAEAHGGSIAVASAPGRGSTFTVRLPLPH